MPTQKFNPKDHRNLFLTLDLLVVFLPALIAVVLCIWGAIASATTSGMVACIVTAVSVPLLVALFYYCRYAYTKHDYVTRHGLYIICGNRNKPTKAEIERLTLETFTLWIKYISENHGKFPNADLGILHLSLHGKRCLFSDKSVVTKRWLYLRGIKTEVLIAGMCVDNEIIIGSGYKKKDGSTKTPNQIFIHEISHPILEKQGIHPYVNPRLPDGGEAHHILFREAGLPSNE